MHVGDFIENRTFDEIAVGESASLTRTLSKDDIALFAVMSGDVNPLWTSACRTSMFHRIIAHGMGRCVSFAVLGTQLRPRHHLSWGAGPPQASAGDTVTVRHCFGRPNTSFYLTVGVNQNGDEVIPELRDRPTENQPTSFAGVETGGMISTRS